MISNAKYFDSQAFNKRKEKNLSKRTTKILSLFISGLMSSNTMREKNKRKAMNHRCCSFQRDLGKVINYTNYLMATWASCWRG
jgi:hypothetical protein